MAAAVSLVVVSVLGQPSNAAYRPAGRAVECGTLILLLFRRRAPLLAGWLVAAAAGSIVGQRDDPLGMLAWFANRLSAGGRRPVEFMVLGPMTVRHGDRELPVRSARERLVLASLLLNADRLTAADQLVDDLWDTPPASARAQLHNMISNLRRRLAVDELIVTRPYGYELRLGTHRLDVRQFRELAEEGRHLVEAGDFRPAAAVLSRAVSLWRGPALADVGAHAGAREALHEEKVAAAELWLHAELELGRHDVVLREVAALLAGYPYRERLHELQIRALASAGRPAEALDAYQQIYRKLVADLGIEPGRSLRDVEQLISRGAARLDPRPEWTAPRELPPACALLTGRDSLRHAVSEALLRTGDATPVVVLVGPGGVGKTALALGCAHGLVDAFPDGQLYANLRGAHEQPVDPHAVAGRFLRALGVDGGNVPEDPAERIALYRNTVAGRRVLVVLDDAVGEQQVRPLLPGNATCATLVTSRRQLGELPGARRWTVPALTPADAVALVARITGPDRVAAEPEAAARIVTACGHLPLATCVSAARLAARTDWTLAEMARRLAEERGRLDELAVGDLDVRASIALSYRALGTQAARLFRRLGLVTAPDWPAWVGEAVAGEPVASLLDQLCDVHLVETLGRDAVGQSRFRLHDLIAGFARERLVDEDSAQERDDALCRLLNGWLVLATEADKGIPHGLTQVPDVGVAAPPPAAAPLARRTPAEWFEAERRSLVAGVEEACRLGWPDLAGWLTLRFSGFLWLRSHDDDWERILHQAVACAREHGAGELLARLLGALFESRGQRDRYAELPGIAAEQLAVARELGHRELEMRALRQAGQAAVRLSRFDEGVRWLDEAVLAARDPGVPSWLLRHCLWTAAWASREAGAPHRAMVLLEEARATPAEPGESIRTGLHHYHYGVVALALGRVADAEQAFTASLKIARDMGDELGLAYLDQALADVDIQRGDWARAASKLDRARQAHERIGSGDGLAEALRSTGDLAAARGHWDDAVTWFLRSLDTWQRIGSTLEIARTLARLERAHAALGDEEAARSTRQRYEAILAELHLDRNCLYLPASQV